MTCRVFLARCYWGHQVKGNSISAAITPAETTNADFSYKAYKRSLGRPKCRWEANIKTGLEETTWGSADWIRVVREKNELRILLDAVIKLPVPLHVGYFFIS